MTALVRYEYRIHLCAADDLEEKLAGWGFRGWEVVGFTATTNKVPIQAGESHAMVDITTYTVIAKKPIGEHPDEPSPPQPKPVVKTEEKTDAQL